MRIPLGKKIAASRFERERRTRNPDRVPGRFDPGISEIGNQADQADLVHPGLPTPSNRMDGNGASQRPS